MSLKQLPLIMENFNHMIGVYTASDIHRIYAYCECGLPIQIDLRVTLK